MNSNSFFITIYLLILNLSLFAQTEPVNSSTFGQAVFEIANIHIKGAEHSDEKSILALSGLKVGQKININGYELPKAIRNLLKIRLYKDVQIHQTRIVEDLIFLEIEILELPRLNNFSIKNIKKSHREEITKLLQPHLTSGAIVSNESQRISKKIIKKYFEEKGYLDAEVRWNELPCPHAENCTRVVIHVDKKQKVKINNITFTGNKIVSQKKLKKLMATKSKPKLLKKKFFIKDVFEADKKQIIAYYHTKGYRDAKFIDEKVNREKNGDLSIKLKIEEGIPYQFGNITWKGNSKYSDTLLTKILGIKKGDIYNEKLLQERLHFSPEGRDVSRLYMDDGHLFFQAKAVEKALNGNQIDIEIQLNEGAQAIIGAIKITGNDITNEEVIRRELQTLPGDKFNREELIRSQRTLINMGYFNPESVSVQPQPNPENGTVDIEYQVEEISNDKIELSGSWGGTGVGIIGTAGIQLNNFSLRKAFQKNGWSPLPRGDGQSLGMRVQYGGKQYQSYNFSFTEPWLRGKPNSLSFGIFHNRYNDNSNAESVYDEHLNIFGTNINYGKRFKIGNEFIISRTGINFQQYNLDNWTSGLFKTNDGVLVSDGKFYNINLTQEFTRTTVNHPIFPTGGSKITLSMQFTPPYSIFNPKNENASIEEKFKLLEYHKWRLDAEKYILLGNKLTLKLAGRMGFMGSYNNTLGTSPFERFQLGGDALSNSQVGFTGTDRITMRGYEVGDFENNIQDGQIVATPLFNKFTAELRYPISLNPAATFYGTAFLEAGNSWSSFSDYNPFKLKRAAGLGLRAHLPMFGTLGVDYGVGFDNAGPKTLSNLGRWNFTLGFELD